MPCAVTIPASGRETAPQIRVSISSRARIAIRAIRSSSGSIISCRERMRLPLVSMTRIVWETSKTGAIRPFQLAKAIFIHDLLYGIPCFIPAIHKSIIRAGLKKNEKKKGDSLLWGRFLRRCAVQEKERRLPFCDYCSPKRRHDAILTGRGASVPIRQGNAQCLDLSEKRAFMDAQIAGRGQPVVMVAFQGVMDGLGFDRFF